MTLSREIHRDALSKSESRARGKQTKKRYYEKHSKRILAARKKRWNSDPAWQARQLQIKRDSLLRTRYGITRATYDEMLAQQDGKCGICRADTPGNGRGNRYFDVDHCHETGKVRGLLCRQCNVLLGQIEKLKRPGMKQAVDSYLKG